MEAKILRTYEPKQTLGTFTYGAYACKTLELAWLDNLQQKSCIPEGIYPVTKEKHAKYGICFRLHNVPGRAGVLIHYGNYAGSLNPNTGRPDSLGCILPGKQHIDLNKDKIKDITESKKVMEFLYSLLPDRFDLEITSIKTTQA